MLKRLALTIWILLITVTGSLHAQSFDPCFDLSPEDCSIIGDASAATLNTLSSFGYSFMLDASLTGLDALDLGTDFALNVTGQGAFNRVSENPAAPFALEILLDASMANPDSQQGSLHLKLVDGTVYQENPPGSGSWSGLSLQEALNSPQLAALNLAGLPLTELNIPSTASQNDADPLDAISTLLNTPGFITYERLDDIEQDGLTFYPFSFQMDFVPLFQSSTFQKALDDGLKFAAQMDPETQNLAMIAPLLLQSSDLKVDLTQFVAPSDGYIHRLTLDLNGHVDLNPLMGTSGDTALDPVRLSLHFEVRLNDLDQIQPVTAPSEYQPLSLDDFGIR